MSATKIGRNTTSILNCYFITLWHIRLNIHIWKTKFTFYKQYFLGLPFSRNVKKSNTDQSLQQAFSFCLKRSVSLTFKNASYKKVFPKCVYDCTTCFAECFLFYVITGNSIFFAKVIVTQRLRASAMLLRSSKQVFWKKSAFYVRYLQNNITMMLIPKVQNKASTS